MRLRSPHRRLRRPGDHHGQTGQFGPAKAVFHRPRTWSLALPSREDFGLSFGRISAAGHSIAREGGRCLRCRPAHAALPVRSEGGGNRPGLVRFDRPARRSLQDEFDRDGDPPVRSGSVSWFRHKPHPPAAGNGSPAHRAFPATGFLAKISTRRAPRSVFSSAAVRTTARLERSERMPGSIVKALRDSWFASRRSASLATRP